MEARAQKGMRQANADEFNRRAAEAGATGPPLSPEQVESAQAAGAAKIHEAMESYATKLFKHIPKQMPILVRFIPVELVVPVRQLKM